MLENHIEALTRTAACQYRLTAEVLKVGGGSVQPKHADCNVFCVGSSLSFWYKIWTIFWFFFLISLLLFLCFSLTPFFFLSQSCFVPVFVRSEEIGQGDYPGSMEVGSSKHNRWVKWRLCISSCIPLSTHVSSPSRLNHIVKPIWWSAWL